MRNLPHTSLPSPHLSHSLHSLHPLHLKHLMHLKHPMHLMHPMHPMHPPHPMPQPLPCNHSSPLLVYVHEEYSRDTPMDKFRADTFLPLTPVAFEILLALADGERHGYSILQDVEQRTGGTVSLHAGTLYRALARLLESELIDELDEAPDKSSSDERRRYYRLTSRGIAVAKAEVARLEGQLAAAKSRRLLKGART
jgi:DNA-binding PadR family transcriptional regulator